MYLIHKWKTFPHVCLAFEIELYFTKRDLAKTKSDSKDFPIETVDLTKFLVISLRVYKINRYCAINKQNEKKQCCSSNSIH